MATSVTNYLIRSKLEGTDPTPTGWTNVAAGTSRAIVAPLDGGADGAKAVLFTNDSNLNNSIRATTIVCDANTKYLASVIVESYDLTAGTNRARSVLAVPTLPAGSTVTYLPCTANPTGGATAAAQAGALLVEISVTGTAGNVTIGLGFGASDTCTGTSQLTRPMFEKRSDGIRGTWVPTDATAVTKVFGGRLFKMMSTVGRMMAR